MQKQCSCLQQALLPLLLDIGKDSLRSEYTEHPKEMGYSGNTAVLLGQYLLGQLLSVLTASAALLL